MGRYLNRRVVHWLQNYLTICSSCGFVVFTYSAEKEAFRTAKWRRKVGLIFALVYFPIGLLVMSLSFSMWRNCRFIMMAVSSLNVHLNIMHMILLQRYRTEEILALLNAFPGILELVQSISHRKVVFSKFFFVRSVVQFVPMVSLLLLWLVAMRPPLLFLIGLLVFKVIPETLVEILHHSVYIALYIVSKMYENLNGALERRRFDKAERISRAYLELYRLSEELNNVLTGYFLLHFLMDLVLLSALLTVMSVKCGSPMLMLFLAASTVNKMRWLMTVADEISERSKFFFKVGVCLLEFHFVQVNFLLYWAYRIDKKLFLKMIAGLILYWVMGNRYVNVVHLMRR